MARENVSPDGRPCPSLVDVYGAVYDIERRIHVLRTLIGKLSPDVALHYGTDEVSASWTRPSGSGWFIPVVCSKCEPAEMKWPE